MRTLSIDIETFSSVDIKESGAYKYVDSDDFEVLLFAYAFDDDPVTCIDLNKNSLPSEVVEAIFDRSVLKMAFNAQFERTALSKYFDTYLGPEDWYCTMVWSWMAGYAGGLDAVSKAMGFPEDKQKDRIGKALINYFCKPCKPTKANGGRIRNLPEHAPEKWEQFIEYNIQDVVVEREIRKNIHYAVPMFEKELWDCDQRIADRGVKIDRQLASKAVELNNDYVASLLNESREITGIENPNSRNQLKEWVEGKLNKELDSFDKNAVDELFKSVTDKDAKRVLEIRKLTSKTSVKKYTKMLDCVCSDGRAHGLLQYYGASRTGRWAGRLIQLQNLPANRMSDLEMARSFLKQGDFEGVELFWEPSDMLSQLIRTALVPSEGNTLLVADYSSAEARCIAWLSDEKWRLDVFSGDGKIYEASASQMFHVPVEQITKGSDLRKKGKVAELALGYQGGIGALKRMGGDSIECPPEWNGSHDDYLQDIVNRWRGASPNVVGLWNLYENAAKKAISKEKTVSVKHDIRFSYENGNLYIKLPSGRKLSYINAEIIDSPKGYGTSIQYMGMNQVTRKWEKMETYGGRITENIVQALSRDCLAVAIVRLEKEGFPVLFHVHDEAICERPSETSDVDLDRMAEIMGSPIDWAPGLDMRADGYLANFYFKD